MALGLCVVHFWLLPMYGYNRTNASNQATEGQPFTSADRQLLTSYMNVPCLLQVKNKMRHFISLSLIS